MNVAVWNIPPADLLAVGMKSGKRSAQFEVKSLPIQHCERALLEGEVDVALLPTLSVLSHHKELDVVPAVALSTWRFPFALLSVEHDLAEPIRRVAFDPEFEQERLLSEVILSEHYRMQPAYEPIPKATPENLSRAEVDARLYVGPEVPTMSLDGRILDLGQEWYELATYPMTWGLFAARKDDLSHEMIREVRDAVRESERRRKVWLRARETSEDLYEFYSNGVRLRLDDLCIAGLTEFRQFLFYYDVVDDVRDIPFVFLPDEEAQDQGRQPLL